MFLIREETALLSRCAAEGTETPEWKYPQL